MYLESNNLLKESQHGYRNNKSCLTNLLEYVEHVTSEIDLGKNVDVIYIDFCKAFDKVCHKKLVLKLKRYGIGGKVLSWITEWLTNRKQRVILNGEKSNWSNVKSGVPQGSVLGSILFLIYIDDIDDKVTSKLFKFADDLKLVNGISNIRDSMNLQKDLDRIAGWAD